MFGFLKRKKIPASNQERIVLIKRLIRLRCDHSLEAREVFATMGTNLEDFDDTIVLGMPEASIMSIVEQYLTGREFGATDDIAIPFLNQSHATLLSLAGLNLPEVTPPYSLERYLVHYLEHIHSHGVPVDPSFVPIAIREVKAFYKR
ncbi:MAG TPA: hypothetical protein VMI53_02820 [Opitutaceae bacterium]|nr:hypothetical protein [Opitutaceae bacterium]